jgi:MFS family permease
MGGVVMIQSDTRRDDRTPIGITIAVGVLVIVVTAMVAAAVPPAYPGWRFGLIAVAVAGFAAVTLDELALAAVAIIAYGVWNGFLEDRFGQLSWHGSEDLWRLLLLVIASAWGLAVGAAYRHVRVLRARWRTDLIVEDAMTRAFRPDTVPAPRLLGRPDIPVVFLKEEEHGA